MRPKDPPVDERRVAIYVVLDLSQRYASAIKVASRHELRLVPPIDQDGLFLQFESALNGARWRVFEEHRRYSVRGGCTQVL